MNQPAGIGSPRTPDDSSSDGRPDPSPTQTVRSENQPSAAGSRQVPDDGLPDPGQPAGSEDGSDGGSGGGSVAVPRDPAMADQAGDDDDELPPNYEPV